MPIETVTIAEPFFGIRHVTVEAQYDVADRAIVVNVSDCPIRVEQQTLAPLQSAIFANVTLDDVDRAIVVERFDAPCR